MSQARGSAQEVSRSCSARENGTAEFSFGISAGGRPPVMTMPERSTNPRAFIRSSSVGNARRSDMVWETIAIPTPR